MNQPLSGQAGPSADTTYIYPHAGLNPDDVIEILADGRVIGSHVVDRHFSRTTLALRVKHAIVPLGTIPTNFALDNIEIPGHTENDRLPTGTWGINLGAAKDNFPHDGLQLFIAPWSNMNVGDSVSILLDSNVVAQRAIGGDAEVGQRVTVFIKPERLTSGAHEIKYRVTRLGGSPEDSVAQAILIKLERPGGQDQDGDVPGHSALILSVPQEIIDDGVDKAQAAAGVTLTVQPYLHMAEGDDIRLSWGGIFVHHVVTSAEAGSAIAIKVQEATILEAGDSDSLALTFEVYDLVDNRSEDWAKETRIVVDTGEERLEAPMIKESDYDSATGRESLDLGKLGNDPVTAEVSIPRTGGKLVVGDQIVIQLRGTTAEGKPITIEYDPVTVSRLGYVLDIPLNNAGVRQLVQSQAIFSYRVIKKDGSADLQSKGLFVAVVGEVERLAAPYVVEAVGNVITPPLPQATVMIPWDDSMAVGQVIVLQWLGTRPDLGTYLPDLGFHTISSNEANLKQAIRYPVAGTHLTPIDGGKLELFYLLYSDARRQNLVSRESLHTPQFLIGEPRGELPAPTVTEAQGGALDPGLAEATVVVPAYGLMAIRDEVHIVWEGSINGNYEDYTVINQFTVGKPVEFYVPDTHIAPNEGGTVKVSYWVKRAAGGTSNSDFLTLQVGEPVGGELEAPSIALIKDGVLNLEDITDTTVTVEVPRWPGIAVGDGLVVDWAITGNVAETVARPVAGSDLGGTAPVKRNFRKATAEQSVDADVSVTYTVEPLVKSS
ncbi:hypothetical protein [Pseudomonas oryziphila]|uniref:Ig-like domain (Group 3) n=1 Tax=Pseudomonas oryziphila TaxID=2894079 RepID=A0ABM7CN30_9PSED|nr:hypothetical protein [Pseudomonas oryziphila]AZL72823.1 hypothetical protein EI693_06835 [Pseudomonas oryziphila]